jgi:hypothetical protein
VSYFWSRFPEIILNLLVPDNVQNSCNNMATGNIFIYMYTRLTLKIEVWYWKSLSFYHSFCMVFTSGEVLIDIFNIEMIFFSLNRCIKIWPFKNKCINVLCRTYRTSYVKTSYCNKGDNVQNSCNNMATGNIFIYMYTRLTLKIEVWYWKSLSF